MSRPANALAIIFILPYLNLGVAASDSVPITQANNQWFKDGVELVKENMRRVPIAHTAKNVIMFLGDGLSIPTVTATRILEGQMRGEVGEKNWLSYERFPATALCKTYNTDQQVPDSAGTATAFLCGVKANRGTIGVDESVKYNYCKTMSEGAKVQSILTLAEKAQMSTGIVTTARVTHATPSNAYAHSASRGFESDKDLEEDVLDDGSTCKDIARQLLEYPHGNGIEVVMGGGRRNFIPNTEADPEYPTKTGYRKDGRNLIDEYLAKYPETHYTWNKTTFDAIDPNKAEKILGLFQRSSMQYDIQRADDEAGEPSLEEMTEKAIRVLSRNPKGYFLLVEGGRIDHGHHAGSAVKALTDSIAMAKAVERAVKMTDKEETLILVTADHAHVFTFGGYPKLNNSIFGLAVENSGLALAKDGLPYTTLGYQNGPGGIVPDGLINGTRRNLTGVDTSDKDFKQQSAYGLSSETHGGDDVAVYAEGPRAYLFHGVVEQSYVFHVMDQALCLSDSKQEVCEKHPARTKKPTNRASTHAQSVFVFLFTLFCVMQLY